MTANDERPRIRVQVLLCDHAQVEAELAAEHEKIAGGVDKAVEIGVVDEIITPGETRSALAAAIRAADTGVRGGHTNIPL